MLVISGIFLFTFRDTGYLGNLIKGIVSNLLKGILETFLFTSRDKEDWYPPYTCLNNQVKKWTLKVVLTCNTPTNRTGSLYSQTRVLKGLS